MSGQPKVRKYKTLRNLVTRFRDDLNSQDFVLLFAYNGTGKTRLSMEYKDAGKRKAGIDRDTLYFNAFTEDLFHWDNDLENDAKRILNLNKDSRFFDGLDQLEMENRIRPFLHRYTDFDFSIDYQSWSVIFFRTIQVGDTSETVEHIKISRGEESVFIWCFFLAIAQLAIDAKEAEEAYSWVKHIYIDDPISSLDDNNAIAVACDMAELLRKGKDRLKVVISSHHGLFFNVMCNELKKQSHKKYFLHLNKDSNDYILRTTDDTPFFHHIAVLSELKRASETGKLYTHHFNSLRSILEKTANFLGADGISFCLDKKDEELHARALNLLSHGAYSLYDPREMMDDNKELFKDILFSYLDRYQFQLPEIFADNSAQASQP